MKRFAICAVVLCAFVGATPTAAIDLTVGKKLKLLDRDGTDKDMAKVKFVKDPAINDPLPDPTTEASRVRISSKTGNTGWFELDMGLWEAAGTTGYKYKDKTGAVQRVVLKTRNGLGKLILVLKGEAYGAVALEGPEDYVDVRLAIGTTEYCGRFEPPTSEQVSNEAGKLLLKGPSLPCPTMKRVFVTSTAYDGNLGGLAGGDAKCQERADAASLGGTWVAWLSTSVEDARDRISEASEYRLVGSGTVVASGLADLTDGQLDAPIDETENGLTTVHSYVWTGTLQDGKVHAFPADCDGWTSISIFDRGHTGTTDSTLGWSALLFCHPWYGCGTDPDNCDKTYPLYCFEE